MVSFEQGVPFEPPVTVAYNFLVYKSSVFAMQKFSNEHALLSKNGGFISIKHNNSSDFTAEILD